MKLISKISCDNKLIKEAKNSKFLGLHVLIKSDQIDILIKRFLN